MQTMLIQLNDEKANKLIHDLEDLNIIKILNEDNKKSQKPSEKYAGKLNLSNDEYEKYQKYIQDSRQEWENRNI